MKERKRIDASNLDEVVDATEPIKVEVSMKYCKASVPGDPERCALVHAAKAQHNFVEFIVHRTVAYARRKDESYRTRYQHPASTRRFVEMFDVGNYKAVKDKNLTFTFYPPKPSIRLSHLRSDDFKKVRTKSDKDRRGKPRRPYRLPDPKTLSGVRNRFGYYDET